jgi:glycosyltransferase involved in cell wall biosynthesis
MRCPSVARPICRSKCLLQWLRCEGIPGHGLSLIPIAGRQVPAMKDLLTNPTRESDWRLIVRNMLSVVICSHNPRPAYFAKCLEALRSQTLTPSSWELVIVDNRSDHPPVGCTDLGWHPCARVVREETLGLTPARLRGIRESKGDLLVFVDDDNVLDADFLETAQRIMDERPFLGSWSGQCRPAFEQPPPEWTRRYWGNLVIREFDKDVWSNLPRLSASMPCGAGLCVRREVADHYLGLHESGKRSFPFDRNGKSLLSGGDNDLAGCACDIGLGVALIASLKLTHLISPERLTEDYLARLAEGIHFSSTMLDAEYGVRAGERTALGRAADCLRVMRLRQPHRRILRAAFRGRDRALRQLIDGDITPANKTIGGE